MVKQFGIHLKVKDINKSLKFYRLLKLKPCFAYGKKSFLKQFKNKVPVASEKYNGVVFEINNTLFEIADGHIAVKSNVFKEKIQSPKISAMIYVSSVNQILKLLKKNNYKISVFPKIYPWGTKELVVKDPDGFVLVFIEKLK
jgi:uncharacterized glyoxalase superfamily protein PhnB